MAKEWCAESEAVAAGRFRPTASIQQSRRFTGEIYYRRMTNTAERRAEQLGYSLDGVSGRRRSDETVFIRREKLSTAISAAEL
jgi:hypothetical protein